MNNKKNKIILLVIGFCIILGTIQGYREVVSSAANLKTELSPFITPPITLGGVTYTVDEGRVFKDGVEVSSVFTTLRVLRVARYSIEQRLHPLFAIEGTDPDLLDESLGLLQRSLDEYLRVYRDAGKLTEAKLLEETLYPMEFLQQLGNLERLRQQVITSPSHEVIAQYNKALARAMRAHRTYAQALRRVFEESGRTGNWKANYLGGTSRVKTIKEVLRTTEKTTDKANRERIQRWICFVGGSCLEKITIPRIPAGNPSLLESGNSLPEAIRTNLEIISNVVPQGIRPDILIALTKNGCSSPDESPAYYSISFQEIDGYRSSGIIIHLLNTLFFQDLNIIPKEILEKEKFFSAAKDAGVWLLPSDPNRMYECPDAGKDQITVNTLFTIHKLVKEHQVFLHTTSTQNLPEFLQLGSLEKDISDSKILYESNVINYVNRSLLLIQKYGEVGLAKLIQEDNVLFLERLVGILNQQSGNLDEIVIKGARWNLLNIVLQENSGPIDPVTLMRIRGYPYLFLMMFNTSVIPEPISFFSERKEVSLESVYIKRYPQDLTTLSKDALIEIIQKSQTSFKPDFWKDILETL